MSLEINWKKITWSDFKFGPINLWNAPKHGVNMNKVKDYVIINTEEAHMNREVEAYEGELRELRELKRRVELEEKKKSFDPRAADPKVTLDW